MTVAGTVVTNVPHAAEGRCPLHTPHRGGCGGGAAAQPRRARYRRLGACLGCRAARRRGAGPWGEV